MIDNRNLHDMLDKYKYMILGAKTLADSISILDKLHLEPEQKKILYNYANSKKYDKCFSLSEMNDYIKNLNNIKYKEDVYHEIHYHILSLTNDISQIHTFTRIANNKASKPEFVNVEKKTEKDNKEKIIVRKCPHCKRDNYIPSDVTEYAICGFSGKEFNSEDRCGQDWCLLCDKKLCKSWRNDDLFLLENRFHDKDCCQKHAVKHNYKYPDDYCICTSKYVNRNIRMDENYNVK